MTSSPSFHVEPLPATFGAVVTNIRLADLSEDAFRALYEDWLKYGLLIVRGQHLTWDEQIAFAKRFGPLEVEIGPLSNLLPDGSVRPSEGDDDDMIKVLKGNMTWHQDGTYMPVQAKGGMLSAITIPSEGGETGFADMEAAYDALDDEDRALVEKLSAYHSLVRSQARLGHVQREGSAYPGYGMDVAEPPLRPMVKIHPETKRKSISIGRHAFSIPGMRDDEAEALLVRLRDQACQPPRVWHHRWTVGDIVIWDNRRIMHRARPWDMREPRVMWHSRMAGNAMSESGISR